MSDLPIEGIDKCLVNCSLLKECALWGGSTFETFFKFGGVTYGDLVRTYNSLQRCIDDLTVDELEWLAAITRTVINPLDPKSVE